MSELMTARSFAEPIGPASTRPGREAQDPLVQVFHETFEPLHRYLNRLSGDPDLASELAQEAFVRLYARRAPPDDPAAWLFTVATNLFRNEQRKRANRFRLMTRQRSLASHSDPAPPPDQASEAAETKARVRAALDTLKVRDRSLLLLAAEGHSYREISSILRIREGSVGTLLRRARSAFRANYEEGDDAR